MVDETLFETVNCNLCGSNNFKIIYKSKYENETQEDLKIKFRSSGDEKLIDQVVICNNCGLIYLNPRIKQNLIIEGYSGGSDETFVSQAKGREITFNKSLKFIEKFQKKGKILDIGTAGGSFLHVAKRRGWEVYGIEPNKWCCEWGKKNYGIDIKPGTIFDNKFQNNFFDVVCLWDVLEHTPEPKKVLEECNKILKNDGLLVVNYPDVGSIITKIMKRKWVFFLSVHLYYFTRETISLILNKTGFKIIKIKPHFQKLPFGYLLFRMKAYNKTISLIGEKFSQFFHLNNLQFPYWLGQTVVIARKR
ncbi:MAG: class I SAM-dependent methyltransferase [Nanoarchaeota archaeon]